ncbi:MAG: 2-phospho-L-lactate guanylyltransferase [Pseudomonadota bacterium]
MTPVHALLPVKDLVRAKTRLAGLLTASERRALAQAMVEDVLSVLGDCESVYRVTIVSDDPAAHLLASRYRAELIEERSLGVSGLNAVLEQSCDRILSREDSVIMVLHGDLPLLTATELNGLLQKRETLGGLVIGCDRHGHGTNLLAFDAGSRPTLCFGVDSCHRHTAVARTAGIEAHVERAAGLGLDVDEPKDLALLLKQLVRQQSGFTHALLSGTELGARLQLALGLEDDDTEAALNASSVNESAVNETAVNDGAVAAERLE